MTSLPILIGIVVILTALRFAKMHILGWIVAWWVSIFIGLKFGVTPPLPSSIINMFMGIVSIALLTYAFSDSEKAENTRRPVINFLIEGKYRIPRTVVVLVVPLLMAYKVFLGMSTEITAPASSRTIHPAPPASISFDGSTVDLVAGNNPFRELEDTDREQFDAHVKNGRRIYYQNCVFCHGDDMHGDGIFSYALDPIPANFADPTTIAMLQETYLFWRIAKGAPGLPEESTPWSSAMPAWEEFLTQEEIWEVILFMYEYTDQKPRAREEH